MPFLLHISVYFGARGGRVWGGLLKTVAICHIPSVTAHLTAPGGAAEPKLGGLLATCPPLDQSSSKAKAACPSVPAPHQGGGATFDPDLEECWANGLGWLPRASAANRWMSTNRVDQAGCGAPRNTVHRTGVLGWEPCAGCSFRASEPADYYAYCSS